MTTKELSGHRNARRARWRARKVTKAACSGRQVADLRLASAKELLIRHHGTRGAAVEAMGGDGYAKVVGHGRGGGFWHNDWRCDKCSETGDPHWVHAKHWHCQICGKPQPADPTRYWQSKQCKALQHGGKGKADGGKGKGGKGGGGKTAETPEAKKRRELEAEKQKTIDKAAIAKLEKEKQQGWGTTATDTADKGDEEDEADVFDVEEAKKTRDYKWTDLKEFEAKAKERPKDRLLATTIEAIKQELAELDKQIREARLPHERLASATKKISKLQTEQSGLEKKIEEEYKAADEAKKKADEHAKKAIEHLAQFEKNEAEISKLSKEANALNEKGREREQEQQQTEEGLDVKLSNTCSAMLKQFDDPYLAADQSLATKKAEAEAMVKSVGTLIAQMAEISTVLQSASEAARKAAHDKAAQTATAAAEAERQAKEVQARAPYAAVVAGAAAGPSSPTSNGAQPAEREARPRGRSPEKKKSRIEGKSRSPAPKGTAGKGKSTQSPLERARAARAASANVEEQMDAEDLRDL